MEINSFHYNIMKRLLSQIFYDNNFLKLHYNKMFGLFYKKNKEKLYERRWI